MTNPFKGCSFGKSKDNCSGENDNIGEDTTDMGFEENTETVSSETVSNSETKNIDENAENAGDKNSEEEFNTPETTELDKVKNDFEQLNNQYLRLAADFENYRKRQEQERENLIRYGAVDTLKKLLEVLDNFDRGKAALENVEDCNVIKDNFNLLHKQVMDVLAKMGLEVIESEGKEFDPNFHEAVMQTPTSEHPEHTVIKELQKGYKLGDKILRPALVNVAVAE